MKSSILKELQRIELAIRGIDPLADIAELEAAQSDMQALIVALQAEDSSLQAQISGNDTDISALQAADTSLQAQISGNDTDISGLQAADTSLQAQISGNDTDISGHNSRISALEASGGGGGIEGYIWAADVKPQGTQSGTFTTGAWRDRTLNTLETGIAGVTLASNIISGIPAGEYIVHLRCPAFSVGEHVARLVTSHGDHNASSGYSIASAQSDSVIHGRIFFSSSATVQVHHICSITRSTNGFGVGHNRAAEIYTQLLMLKIG